MKLPQDIHGRQLAALLGRCGYAVTRETGNHLHLTSKVKGSEHRLTTPADQLLNAGTLEAILEDVAFRLQVDRERLIHDLFEK